MPTIPFKGVIKLDVRDSKEDWAPYTPPKAPDGAPNVLFVLTTTRGSRPGRRSAAGSTCRRCSGWPTTG